MTVGLRERGFMRLPEREEIFRNHGEQHPLWRVVLLAAGFLLGSLVLGIPALLLFPPPDDDPTAILNLESPTFIASAWAMLAAAAAVVYLLTRRMDRQEWQATGLWLHPGWVREALSGVLLGALMIAAVFVVLNASGIAGTTPGTQPARALLLGVVVLLPMALTEELLFRGYLLRNLAQAWGGRAALALSAAIFAIFHLSNPDRDALALVNIAVMGVLMGYAYLQSGSLWFPFGLHFAWNFTQGTLLGMPISGLGIPGLIRTHLGLPHSLSGGPFGPEASILATVVMALGFGYIMWRYGGPASIPRGGGTEGENPRAR
jgi:membrane protease YdiL (CAAX protease family)